MIRALEQLGLEDFPTLEEEPPKPKQPARPPCMSRVNGQVAQSLLERIKAAQAKPEGEAND
jgi:hypothetical protein